MKGATEKTHKHKKEATFPVKPPSRVALAFLAVVVIVLAFGLSAKQSTVISQKEKELKTAKQAAAFESDKEYVSSIVFLYQEAVDNSRYIAERTSDEELKTYADSIVSNQTKSIWRLISIYQASYGQKFPSNQPAKVMVDLSAVPENLEKNYIQGMIDHHQAAIERSRATLNNTESEELKKFARDEIDSKNTELNKLRNWLTKYQ